MSILSEHRWLKGFEQHGARFVDSNDTQAIGVCPFCGKFKKFFVNLDNKLWDCKTCLKSGNFNQFLSAKSKEYQDNFRGKLVTDLANNRGLRPQTLMAWGVGWSGEFYSLPVDGNGKRVVTDLRRYNLGRKPLATTGSKLSFIAPIKLHDSERIWLMEGEWDGMALWECFQSNGIKDDIYCTPGAGNLPIKLLELFYGKEVIVVTDNDDPGRTGAFKANEKLISLAKTMRFVHWPTGLPDGFDFRDLYLSLKRNSQQTLLRLNSYVQNEPPPVLPGDSLSVSVKLSEPKKKTLEELTGPGLEYEEVSKKYKEWLYLKDTECLEVLFGTAFANRIDGDPLWLFLVGPPGSLKTELIMSISSAPRITPLTSLTPHALISGATIAGGKDPSLIPELDKRVLAIKDVTTVFSMNSIQRDFIFGVLRDAFDGKCEWKFGNGIHRKYESTFGIMGGVTSIVESLNQTNMSLGERFIKYKIKQFMHETGSRKAIRQALKNIKVNSTMREELNEVGSKVLNRDFPTEAIPDVTDEMMERFISLAQWVAMLRGVVCREKYTGIICFKPGSEVGTRLAKQFCKLAYGIGFFKGEDVVSEATYRTIVSVAQDTAPDRVEEVVKKVYTKVGEEYCTTREVEEWTGFPHDTTRFLLQDLVLLRIMVQERGKTGGWALSPYVYRLMNDLGLYKSKPRRIK